MERKRYLLDKSLAPDNKKNKELLEWGPITRERGIRVLPGYGKPEE